MGIKRFLTMRDTSKFKTIPFRIPNELHAQATERLEEVGGKFQGLLIRLLERWLEGSDTPRIIATDEAAKNAAIVASLRELIGSKAFERLTTQLGSPKKGHNLK